MIDRLKALAEDARLKAEQGEVAFYGGTFTALPRQMLHRLLQEAACWVDAGVFSGIRFSTRPDSLSEEDCALLQNYPVTTVELGVQSFEDAVLERSGRGYGAGLALETARRVKEYGWQLGLQLMPGLPDDSREAFLRSIAVAVDLKPGFVRLYPTLVLQGTALAKAHALGVYQPLTVDEAVSWCAEALEMLKRAKVAVARMGLHADPELLAPGRIIAGPFHPAFGYLVRVRWWRNQVDKALGAELDECRVSPRGERGSVPAEGRSLALTVPRRLLSEAVGPAQGNIKHWQERWGIKHVTVRGEDTPPAPGFRFCWQ